ncbi:MAG: alpha/beta hydrolase [Nevskia sp.]
MKANLLRSESSVILEPATAANAAVIWLHGLGADGNDFVPIVPELDLPDSLSPRFVFPHAPVRPVTLNGGMPMRAWYDIISLNRGERQDEAGTRASAAALTALVEQQVAAGIPASRIVIAGFSQGGAIALHCAARLATPLAGVMALSTYLPLHDRVEAEITAAGRATPILMCHGLYDNVLPPSLGADSRDGLRRWGFEVEWHEYPMMHAVCAEEIDDIAAFLRRRLAAA